MRNTRSKNGFTVAELMLALAISVLLLVAVAVAFNASVANYQENEAMFRSLNSGRQALSRITSQVRTATAVDPNAPVNECSLITADGNDITYRYNSSDSKVYLVTNDDLSDSDYVVCDNVVDMSFTRETGVEDSVVYVKSVQVSMTVSSGDVEQTVAAAAVVRRNLE